ncbi:MAG TPA: ABC transporter ATP-binding protein [Bacteroidia bacterium]|nr:ABC transporter ATP-binding protein [Bacteroidia bacterium]HMU18693.1 ABC transporter ATP-binding protein [Bacteroidia bacterium]
MKILVGYLKRHWKLVLLALLLAAVNQCFSLLDPLIAGKMLDRFAMHVSNYNDDFPKFFKDIIWFLMASMGVALVSRIAKNFQDYFVNVIVQRTGAEMYSDGIKHSLELPYQVFEDQRSGETLGKLQKVRADSEKFINAFISILFQSVVGIIFVMAYAINVHWSIAPVFLLTVPVLAIVSNMLSKKIKVISKKILGETTALAGATTESLRNIELVKSLGLANQEINRLNTVTDKILNLELKKVKYIRSLSFIQGTTVNFLRTLFVFLLYYLIFKDDISPGKMMTLMFYSFFIFGPLQELGNVIAIYREAQASLNNFNEIMEMPLEYKPQSPHQLNAIETFEFNNVSFKHITAQGHALKNISFKAKRGETIAFVGPSGSGKSTLVKLLVGLYHPAEGKILYNGIDASNINLNELREQIGFVTQDTQLFAGTIRENLLFVNPQAVDEQILNALNMASCHTLLARAENGLNTVIGEGGVKVSGGEKQRLSIARALLRNPNLLVLDEATSALDSITEEEITETIKSINKNKNLITILIAHRLSTIMHADHIFVLEKGQKIEEGRHETLLEEKGLYYAMWRQQIGERKKVENVVITR